ncbi:MAG TPA: hypothetical protein VHE55_09550 [Fimbriimonadaceae bacterium]|nr:hypothetical protein [Fimbriimonadaceae bacterium]
MSKAKGVGPAPTREINEGLIEFLAGVARFLMWAGVLATVVGVGFLVFTAMSFSNGASPGSPDAALNNVSILEKILFGGVLALGVATSYLFWGEQVLAALQIMGAAILFFAPMILSSTGIASPSITGGEKDPVAAAMQALNHGGMVLGMIGFLVLAVDLGVRARDRAKQGWKADQMRYGKGVKEEQDRHNVFLGKCWQLPFCRKFVRERCPIYHARRTCWKELTGCMCEEEVIRNAMENKVVPKDALMAATYIPRNMKLTTEQKQERCRSCVIYNEHQKHKYKALMPATLGALALIYVVGHPFLISVVGSILNGLDRLINRATYGSVKTLDQPTTFQELLLICLMIVVLAYALKILEYLIFKLKV